MIQRLVIIGLPGSGKSTVGTALARAYEVPYHAYDHLKWRSPGIAFDREQLSKKVQAVVHEPSWLLEGCTDESWWLTLPYTDMIIWLDYSLAVTLNRLIRRQIELYRQGRSGKRGKMASRFSATQNRMPLIGIIGWIPKHRSLRQMIVRTLNRRARYTIAIADLAPEASLIRLRSPRECDDFLRTLMPQTMPNTLVSR